MKSIFSFGIEAARLLSSQVSSTMEKVVDPHRALTAVAQGYQAVALDEAQLKDLCVQLRDLEEIENVLAEEGSPYDERLARLTENLESINGIALSYKVYISEDENANALPDGSVRVYSGLMDLMEDDELRFVLAHEVGHVALGHSKKRMQVAYVAKAGRTATSALFGMRQLSDSILGDIMETFLNSQFSQTQEDAADEFSVLWMKKNGYDTKAAVSAMKKTGEGGGGLLSTHPSGAERIKHIEKVLAN